MRRLEDEVFAQIRRELAEAEHAPLIRKADLIHKSLHERQREAQEDPARFKAICTPRQVGKSTLAKVEIAETMLRRPKRSVLYITDTGTHAKELLWIPLQDLDSAYELGFRYHGTALVATAPNGSRVRFGGAESDADVHRYRGGTHDLVIIDEVQSLQKRILTLLLDSVIRPAIAVRKGRVLLLGTPGHVLEGLFYELTGPEAFQVKRGPDGVRKARSRPYRRRNDPEWQGVEFEYSFHTWTAEENTAAPDLWKEFLEAKRAKGWSDQHPVWRRESLGQWVSDLGHLVYKFNPARDTWEPGPKTDDNPFGLPDGHDWRYILGLDLGFDDPFAVVVMAYSQTHPVLYQVYEAQYEQATVPVMATVIRELEAKVGEFESMVGDRGGLGKALLAQLAEEYGLAVQPAEKTDKRDHIELLNSDFAEGRCKLLKDGLTAEEMVNLQWDPKRPGKEVRTHPNHLCDATIYTWREAQHHYAETRRQAPPKGSVEWERARRKEEARRMDDAERRKADPDAYVADNWFGAVQDYGDDYS